jgi:poly-gamma-glutamate capsule biosynthesis protein CapA/YwtB (metallophosphatase superfamily)
MKKIFLFSLISLFFLFPLFLEKETLEKEKQIEEKTYTLLFTGDIMLSRGVEHMIKKHGEDFSFPFLNIREKLQSVDLLFGNLESMISDKGRKIGSIYSFRADKDAINALTYAGFDIVSLANNHTFDYDREAFEETMHLLEENNISYTGAGFNKEKAHSPTILLLGEKTKIGFLGYTEFLYPYTFAKENLSGITNFSEEQMEIDIKNAKGLTDFLVVTFHYGDEYQKLPNEKQKKWSRMAIDYGADLIIGHHPHVTQPVENYNGKYIAYSLGNFVFDQYFSEETMKGFLLEVRLKENEVISVKKIHYKLNEFYQPEVTEEELN